MLFYSAHYAGTISAFCTMLFFSSAILQILLITDLCTNTNTTYLLSVQPFVALCGIALIGLYLFVSTLRRSALPLMVGI